MAFNVQTGFQQLQLAAIGESARASGISVANPTTVEEARAIVATPGFKPHEASPFFKSASVIGPLALAIGAGVGVGMAAKAAQPIGQDLTSVVLSPDDVSRLAGSGVNLAEFQVAGAPQEASWLDYIEAGRAGASRSSFMQGVYDVLGVSGGGELLGGALAGLLAGSLKESASPTQTGQSVAVPQGTGDDFGGEMSLLGMDETSVSSSDSGEGFSLDELFSSGIPLELLS